MKSVGCGPPTSLAAMMRPGTRSGVTLQISAGLPTLFCTYPAKQITAAQLVIYEPGGTQIKRRLHSQTLFQQFGRSSSEWIKSVALRQSVLEDES